MTPRQNSRSTGRICAGICQPADEPPPTSAGSGGGNGTAELGAAAGVLGADDVAPGDPDFVGDAEAEVLGFDVAVPDVDVEEAGDWGPWKSLHVSVRNVSPFAVTLSAVGVMVYFTPPLSTTKVSLEVCEAVAIRLAPSRTRTPRYS